MIQGACGISETVIYGYPERQLVVKNVPRLECQKCGLMMQAEPNQSEKTDVFIVFLKSVSLWKAEIECFSAKEMTANSSGCEA